MAQASVRVDLLAPELCHGGTRNLISIQKENAPLILFEFRSAGPSHVIALREAHDKLVPFDFSTFQYGLNLDDGFMPIRSCSVTR